MLHVYSCNAPYQYKLTFCSFGNVYLYPFQQDIWDDSWHSRCGGLCDDIRPFPGNLLSAHEEKGTSLSGGQISWRQLSTKQHRRLC